MRSGGGLLPDGARGTPGRRPSVGRVVVVGAACPLGVSVLLLGLGQGGQAEAGIVGALLRAGLGAAPPGRGRVQRSGASLLEADRKGRASVGEDRTRGDKVVSVGRGRCALRGGRRCVELQGVKDRGIGGNLAADRRPGMLHGASSPRDPCRSVPAAAPLRLLRAVRRAGLGKRNAGCTPQVGRGVAGSRRRQRSERPYDCEVQAVPSEDRILLVECGATAHRSRYVPASVGGRLKRPAAGPLRESSLGRESATTRTCLPGRWWSAGAAAGICLWKRSGARGAVRRACGSCALHRPVPNDRQNMQPGPESAPVGIAARAASTVRPAVDCLAWAFRCVHRASGATQEDVLGGVLVRVPRWRPRPTRRASAARRASKASGRDTLGRSARARRLSSRAGRRPSPHSSASRDAPRR